ncbi:phosphotransferase [Notoacmeibacter ruber]|uniref:Aminoglycoside phosphotransferase domain-containing protein n=1 Tax=Notoacmeibacter ruber TaxID=2670375 RepID=A0A3L7JAL6_9HYPH|nr:phosphotransferase [Notoacmeibacter ruber]RLQ87788.1 hypothetical protein D8780_05790 [Notoacmeibacter ruber]
MRLRWKKIRRFWRRQHTYFLTDRYFYKLLIGPSARRKRNAELSAQSQIPRRWPWLDASIVIHEAVLNLPWLIVLRAPLVNGRGPTEQEAMGLAETFLRSDRSSYETLTWEDALPPSFLFIIWPMLPQNVRFWITETLGSMYLPATGCHGDFATGNLIVLGDGTIAVIDWEMYREQGSFVEDICRFLATSVRTTTRPGDIEDLFRTGVFQRVTDRLQLTELQMVALYIVSQASCELGWRPPRRIAKSLVRRVEIAERMCKEM